MDSVHESPEADGDARGAATFGGAFVHAPPSAARVRATMIQCCEQSTDSDSGAVFGSATVDATPVRSSDSDERNRADGLARYYPMTVDDRELAEAEALSPPDPLLVQRIKATGRDIAHGIDAGAFGDLVESENGVMCEEPEQFRLSRYYYVPSVLNQGTETLQFDYRGEFTVSLWFRWEEIRQEQTLFSLDPVLRFGVSWLGEIALAARMVNGALVEDWSTTQMQPGQWYHLALVSDPHAGQIRAYIDGTLEVTVELTKPLAEVEDVHIGLWRDGSLINGDVQDVRIYHGRKRTEFIFAESTSYCADWVEVQS